jgi:hypothetical protein
LILTEPSNPGPREIAAVTEMREHRLHFPKAYLAEASAVSAVEASFAGGSN